MFPVTHRREDLAKVGVSAQSLGDRPDGVRPGIHDFARAGLSRREPAGAIRHLAVGDRGAVFDDQDRTPRDEVGARDPDLRSAAVDSRPGIELAAAFLEPRDGLRIGGVDLVDDDDVREQKVREARVVPPFMALPMGIHHDEVEIGPEEGGVIVAPVPEEDVRFLFGFPQDALVVDARIDDEALVEERLELLAFLDGAVVAVEILVAAETLADLPGEFPVRHGMSDRDRPLAQLPEQPHQKSGRLRFARSRANRRDGDDGSQRTEHCAGRGGGREMSARRVHPRSEGHDVLEGDVGVGKPGFFDPFRSNEILEFLFREDRDPFGVVGPRKLRRVGTSRNRRDLGGREGHDLNTRIVPEEDVEVVEVATGGSQDDDASARHLEFRWRGFSRAARLPGEPSLAQVPDQVNRPPDGLQSPRGNDTLRTC